MDETIKVYKPRKQLEIERKMEGWGEIMEDKKKQIVVKRHKKQGGENRLQTLINAIGNLDKQTYEREQRHPWAVIFYKWITALCVFALMGSFVWWGIDIAIQTKASAAYDEGVSVTVAAQEAREAEVEKARQEEEQSVAKKKASDISLMAKFLAGIQGFVENKGYTDADLETYGQCPINRVLNPAFACETLEEAIKQEGQWVGFSMNNQPTIKHQQIAEKLVNRLYNDEAQPCSNTYCWTEFTDKGLWLKNDYGPATFNNTWRAV